MKQVSSKLLPIAKAARVAKCSTHTLRNMVNNMKDGQHDPLIDHLRVGTVGQPTRDGRRGKILISENEALRLREKREEPKPFTAAPAAQENKDE